MKNEVGRLLVISNFNIQRVQESIQANSEKAIPVMKTELFNRLDKLGNNEKNTLSGFLADLTESEIFVSNLDENPIETDGFKRIFARIHAVDQNIGEHRFLVMAQESGILNKLLKITKRQYLLEYIPSITIRRAKEEIIKRLENTTLKKKSNLVMQVQNMSPELLSILKDVVSSKGVLHAPFLTVPDTLESILAKYKNYVALSPLIHKQVQQLLEAKPEKKAKDEIREIRRINLKLRDSLGNPIPDALVQVGSTNAATSKDGTLSLQMPQGSYSMTARKGVDARTVNLQLENDMDLELQLESSQRTIGGIKLGGRFDFGHPMLRSPDAVEDLSQSLGEIEIPIEDLLCVNMVIGASRSGKTTTAKRIVEQMMLSGAKFVLIDFKGEYKDFLRKFDFRSFSLKPSRECEALALNMLDRANASLSIQGYNASIEDQSRLLVSFVSEYFSQEYKPLTEQQKSLLLSIINQELEQTKPTFEGLVQRIQRNSEESTKSFTSLIRKTSVLNNVFGILSNASLRYILGQNVLIDISGKGFHRQPNNSEKLLMCYSVLKVLESAIISNTSKPMMCIDEITSQPKDDIFKQEANRLLRNLVKTAGVVIVGKEVWYDFADITKTIVAHRQQNERLALDFMKLLPQADTKDLASQLQKMPPNFAVVRSNCYTGLAHISLPFR